MRGEWGMTGSHDPAHCICLPWACDWRHRPGERPALITVEATVSWTKPVDSAAHHLNPTWEPAGPAGVGNYPDNTIVAATRHDMSDPSGTRPHVGSVHYVCVCVCLVRGHVSG